MSIDLSLERIQRLYALLPPYTRPTIHIAGTNGKGSVCALVSSILQTRLSIGRFNSPHLVSVTDSVIINGAPISQETYDKTRTHIHSISAKHGIEVSSFELLTLIALFVFESAKVEFVVLEVGMGGRLDATNVIPDESVVLSALTSVDLDHQQFLGNTVEAIAREKAGIARRGKPFIMGTQRHNEVETIVREVVTGKGAQFDVPKQGCVEQRPWDEASDGTRPSGLSLSSQDPHEPPAQPVSISLPCFDEQIHALFPLHGDHQLENLSLAVTIISTLISHSSCDKFDLKPLLRTTDIAKGIASTKWPGRLSYHILDTPQLLVLADGAHNAASAETLARYLQRLVAASPQPILITYVLALSDSPTKTPLQTLAPLVLDRDGKNTAFRVATLRFTPPEGMPWVKSVDPTAIAAAFKTLSPSTEVWIPGGDIKNELDDALEWAAIKGGSERHLVVVAGSLYLVADLYRRLGVHV